MNKKNGPTLGHNKKSLLKSEVAHIDITSFDSRKIIESMKKMSFTSRDTAKAAEIYNEMIKDKNCSIFLTWKYAIRIKRTVKSIKNTKNLFIIINITDFFIIHFTLIFITK